MWVSMFVLACVVSGVWSYRCIIGQVAAQAGSVAFVVAQDARKDLTTNGFTTLGTTSPGDVQVTSFIFSASLILPQHK